MIILIIFAAFIVGEVLLLCAIKWAVKEPVEPTVVYQKANRPKRYLLTMYDAQGSEFAVDEFRTKIAASITAWLYRFEYPSVSRAVIEDREK